MRKYLILSAFLSLALPSFGCCDDTVVQSFFSEIDGKMFEFEIEESHIDDAPKWLDENPCPPVSPKRAITVSEAGLKLYASRGIIRESRADMEWKLMRLTLNPVWGGWYWVAEYSQFPKTGGSTGISAEASVVVLMNGKVLIPKPESRSDLPSKQ
ncbi:MAG: hypothetical protein R3C53_05125 [Pirellulaceae bacterium]